MSTDIRTTASMQYAALAAPLGYTRKAGTPEVEDGHSLFM